MTGPAARGARLPYGQLPEHVRAFVESTCGEVVGVTDHPTGFSPGAAATVSTLAGERFFVKAVSGDINAVSRDLHLREGINLDVLGSTALAPRLIAVFDQAPWAALVTEEVSGALPGLPWSARDLGAFVNAMDALADVLAPPALRPLGEVFGKTFTGWRALAADSANAATDAATDAAADSVDAAAAADAVSRRAAVRRLVPYLPADLACRIDEFAAVEREWVASSVGDAVLHGDARGDNLLIDNGRARLVDWPSACRGNPVCDVVGASGAVAMQGGPAPREFVAMTQAGRRADPYVIRVAAVVSAGYLVNAARMPPPPGLPTVRAFQQAQAVHFYDWLRALL